MLTIEELKNYGIDAEKGLRFFGFDMDMYQKYLVEFAREDYVDKAMEQINHGDIKGAFSSVHKLKALVEYVCIPSIDTIVHEVTETLREGKTDGVMVGLIFIKNASSGVKQAILDEAI